MNNEDLSVVFMGTPEFAVPALEQAHRAYGVKAVVTVPDQPKGRGKVLSPSPVKEKALELGLPILQPEKLKNPDFIEQLSSYKPDIIAVIAFRILPEEVYSLAKIGAFNIHGSLLPKYRGAAPINWAIINGEKKSGLTSFLLKKIVDTGDMLLQWEYGIPEGFTAGDLHDMLMPEAARMAVDTIELLIQGIHKPMPQSDEAATPAPKLFRENCKINWQKNAEELRNYIHGVSPVPGAWTIWNGKRLKILRADYYSGASNEPGSFIIENDIFTVSCIDGSLNLIEIQPEGKKAMRTSDFLKGYRGITLGKMEDAEY